MRVVRCTGGQQASNRTQLSQAHRSENTTASMICCDSSCCRHARTKSKIDNVRCPRNTSANDSCWGLRTCEQDFQRDQLGRYLPRVVVLGERKALVLRSCNSFLIHIWSRCSSRLPRDPCPSPGGLPLQPNPGNRPRTRTWVRSHAVSPLSATCRGWHHPRRSARSV